jgi:hypothetical protein
VTSYGWDTHGDNFNGHLSLVPKVDMAFSAVLEDLQQRGMLDNVLVILMSEFGRTPRINGHLGRDHWPEAWSLAMAGCGLKKGWLQGKPISLAPQSKAMLTILVLCFMFGSKPWASILLKPNTTIKGSLCLLPMKSARLFLKSLLN